MIAGVCASGTVGLGHVGGIELQLCLIGIEEELQFEGFESTARMRQLSKFD